MIFEPNIIFLESAQNIAIMVLFENRVKFPTLCKKNHWDIFSRCKTASLRKSSTHLRFVSREVRSYGIHCLKLQEAEVDVADIETVYATFFLT